MDKSVTEILSLAESEARWFHDSAQTFAQFAARLNDEEKAEMDLLASVYRERAQTIQRMVDRVRENFASDDMAPGGTIAQSEGASR